jgi:hypothetical protein
MAVLADSNVLIDLLEPGSPWFAWSSARLREAKAQGAVAINAVVAAEVAVGFTAPEALRRALSPRIWRWEEMTIDMAYVAGSAFRRYRESGGRRERTLPDFFIGAHAVVAGHRLLTRDGARYRTYFPELPLIAPDTHP